MRVCLRKSDNKLIEMQSYATPGTLIKNAIAAGYAGDAVEEKELTQAEYAALVASQIDPRAVIRAKLAEIDRLTGSVRWIRELALGCDEAWTLLREGPLPELPEPGTGMAKVRAIEEQCAELRKQLALLG